MILSKYLYIVKKMFVETLEAERFPAKVFQMRSTLYLDHRCAKKWKKYGS